MDAYWIQRLDQMPDVNCEMETDALATDRGTPQLDANARKGWMSDLKQQIERHEYRVDSERVAEEMIKRMRLAHWARRSLVSDAGGSQIRPAAAG